MGSRRTSTDEGPNPISHLELDAWARRHRYDLQPFEYQALDLLERMFLNHHKENKK